LHIYPILLDFCDNIKITMDSRNMIPTIDARMDLGWERSFNEDKWAIRLYAGYDFHVLINAFNAVRLNPIFSLVEGTYSGQIDNGNLAFALNPVNEHSNLYLQGLNVGLSVSF